MGWFDKFIKKDTKVTNDVNKISEETLKNLTNNKGDDDDE